MINDPELRINAEGVFISCSQDRTRIWEFHPDDVTSVGLYVQDGQKHEVIVTLLRDFDVPETTSGLKELNERLSRELNASLSVETGDSSSAFGVVLWPHYLAGGFLWEFYTLGKDGLADYVAPDTPNAIRNLSHAVSREKGRFAKPRLPVSFPKPLIDRAFTYHHDIGWYKEDALAAAGVAI